MAISTSDVEQRRAAVLVLDSEGKSCATLRRLLSHDYWVVGQARLDQETILPELAFIDDRMDERVIHEASSELKRRASPAFLPVVLITNAFSSTRP